MTPDAPTVDPGQWRQDHWDVPGAIYFWSQRQGPHRQFSMFADTPFLMPAWFPQLGWLTFDTGEHAFHCAKATNPHDHEWIRTASPDPMAAKNIGRGRVPHPRDGHRILLPPDWNATRRFRVMLLVNRHKFARDPLRDLLLSTGDATLAEDSPYDPDWGCRRRLPDGSLSYTGHNYLGRALMRVRHELRQGAAW